MMTKRFQIFDEMVIDTKDIVPTTLWQNEKQKQKYCDELNKLAEENEQLKEEIARQKFSKKIMRENIKDYERAIKRLRKSYEKFDEMRLDRIRFLEKRLKKNGLSIYVNGCGDLE